LISLILGQSQVIMSQDSDTDIEGCYQVGGEEYDKLLWGLGFVSHDSTTPRSCPKVMKLVCTGLVLAAAPLEGPVGIALDGARDHKGASGEG
jgi:hypothetical protein